MHRFILLAAAVAAFPLSGLALPLISEVFYDASGSDDGKSFVELWGAPGTDLSGFFLEGINGSNGSLTHRIELGGVIPTDGLFVVADAEGEGSTLVSHFDWVADFDFQNGPDSVLLRDAGGVVDAVGYGVFGAGEVFAGEGAPAPDAPADSSIARRFADLDTGDNASDFSISAPSPGSAARQVPEPGSGALLGLGLLAFCGRSRGLLRAS